MSLYEFLGERFRTITLQKLEHPNDIDMSDELRRVQASVQNEFGYLVEVEELGRLYLAHCNAAISQVDKRLQEKRAMIEMTKQAGMFHG